MSFAEKISSMSKDCLLLSDDINAIIHSRIKSSEPEKIASRKSLEPMARLRKNAEDLKNAAERDPQDQFVLDKLTDIFGG